MRYSYLSKSILIIKQYLNIHLAKKQATVVNVLNLCRIVGYIFCFNECLLKCFTCFVSFLLSFQCLRC